MVDMIFNVQIFGGPHHENLGGQKPQNFARFRTILDFDHKCLRNRLRYQKSGANSIEGDLCRV